MSGSELCLLFPCPSSSISSLIIFPPRCIKKWIVEVYNVFDSFGIGSPFRYFWNDILKRLYNASMPYFMTSAGILSGLIDNPVVVMFFVKCSSLFRQQIFKVLSKFLRTYWWYCVFLLFLPFITFHLFVFTSTHVDVTYLSLHISFPIFHSFSGIWISWLLSEFLYISFCLCLFWCLVTRGISMLCYLFLCPLPNRWERGSFSYHLVPSFPRLLLQHCGCYLLIKL